jgi:hypothetical protein
MDIILDSNAYIAVLHNHGRGFLETNQFAELLAYLRRTGSRLVIPELTYNEVVARYRDRLTAVTKVARDAGSTLQNVSMKERMSFIEPDIKSELNALGKLLNNPAPGVQTLMYSDYSGVDIKEVARRGIGRMRPANENGEELRDVILWLVVLQYAKQSKTPVAFVSGDKTFQDKEGSLDPSLLKDVERAKVNITFYPLIRDFVKGNALQAESIRQEALAAYVSAEEIRGISTEQLLGSRFWDGTIVGAEVLRCELASAQRYRVGENSYYIEARYLVEATIRLSRLATTSIFAGATTVPQGTTGFFPHFFPNTPIMAGPFNPMPLSGELRTAYNAFYGEPVVPEASEKAYKCSFSLRLSLRISEGMRETLEVDGLILLGELEPIDF